jgi:hypothetical protein
MFCGSYQRERLGRIESLNDQSRWNIAVAIGSIAARVRSAIAADQQRR